MKFYVLAVIFSLINVMKLDESNEDEYDSAYWDADDAEDINYDTYNNRYPYGMGALYYTFEVNGGVIDCYYESINSSSTVNFDIESQLENQHTQFIISANGLPKEVFSLNEILYKEFDVEKGELEFCFDNSKNWQVSKFWTLYYVHSKVKEPVKEDKDVFHALKNKIYNIENNIQTAMSAATKLIQQLNRHEYSAISKSFRINIMSLFTILAIVISAFIQINLVKRLFKR